MTSKRFMIIIYFYMFQILIRVHIEALDNMSDVLLIIIVSLSLENSILELQKIVFKANVTLHLYTMIAKYRLH